MRRLFIYKAAAASALVALWLRSLQRPLTMHTININPGAMMLSIVWCTN